MDYAQQTPDSPSLRARDSHGSFTSGFELVPLVSVSDGIDRVSANQNATNEHTSAATPVNVQIPGGLTARSSDASSHNDSLGAPEQVDPIHDRTVSEQEAGSQYASTISQHVRNLDPCATRPNRWARAVSTTRAFILDTWLVEIFAVVFSTACIIAIAAVLYAYDDKPIPQLSSGLTLNTIVSILSTAARIALILIVSTSIGQLKWCRYKTSARTVQDAQTLDDASRGPLGAAIMLVTRTGGFLATLDGIITLLMVAFSPFFQQMLEYPVRYPRKSSASARILQNLNFTIDPYGELPFRSAAMAGLHAEANTFDRTPTCPSSRCDWDPYKSIEWCTKCEDLSSIATLEDCDYEKHMKEVKLSRYVPTFDFCKLKLGKGRVCPLIRMVNETAETDSGWGRAPSSPSLRIDFAHEGIWLISNPRLYEVEKETFNYLGIDNPLVVLGHFHAGYEFKEKTLVLSMPTLTILNASQCVITLCEREYAVEMRDAIPAARLISTNYGRVLDDSDDEYEKILGWSSPGSQVNSSNLQSLVGYIAELFLGGATQSWFFKATWDFQNYTGRIMKQTSKPEIIGPGSVRSLEARLVSLAASLTSYGLGKTNNTLSGYAFAEERYVHVRWWWIVMPVVLQASSVALFVATVVHSNRYDVPTWKSSLLAVWYHTPKDLHGEDDVSWQLLSDMGRNAGATGVTLVHDVDDSGLTFRKVSLIK